MVLRYRLPRQGTDIVAMSDLGEDDDQSKELFRLKFTGERFVIAQ